MLKGKYINDPEVLREAAKAAGVQDFERVLSDPTVALHQVCAECHKSGKPLAILMRCRCLMLTSRQSL